MTRFVHLHVHTEYSLLDGLSRIKDLVSAVKSQGGDAVAITDHGVLYGAIEFYKKAKEQEIKPIIGMEAYITESLKKEEGSKGQTHHLLLLSKNKQGYENLMELSSIAHLEGFYYKPRIDKEILAKYKDGLIVSSGCMQGEVSYWLKEDNYNKAREVASWYLDLFGEDYYLEIQRHNFRDYLSFTQDDNEIKANIEKSAKDEEKVNDGLVKLSRDLGIPLIATNDVHYIKKEDAVAQDALVCISTGKTVDDKKRLRYVDTPDFYLKTPEEMVSLFADLPDAIQNTVKVAEKCNLEIELGKWYFPKFPLPDGTTAEEQLKKMCYERVGKG